MNNTMIKIPIATFIEFVHSAGIKRVSLVKEAKHGRYSPATDFYRPLRDAIVDFHKAGSKDARPLQSVAAQQSDPKKSSGYPTLITAYLRFARKHDWTWAGTPPKPIWTQESLSVSVSPEILVNHRGTPHLVKLWLRRDPLDRHKVASVLLMLRQCVEELDAPLECALLDVRRGKLHLAKAEKPEVDVLLRGEARAFQTMYASV